ncbi:unnamed protein product [Gordionus sp. m RMFG-2023]
MGNICSCFKKKSKKIPEKKRTPPPAPPLPPKQPSPVIKQPSPDSSMTKSDDTSSPAQNSSKSSVSVSKVRYSPQPTYRPVIVPKAIPTRYDPKGNPIPPDHSCIVGPRKIPYQHKVMESEKAADYNYKWKKETTHVQGGGSGTDGSGGVSTYYLDWSKKKNGPNTEEDKNAAIKTKPEHTLPGPEPPPPATIKIKNEKEKTAPGRELSPKVILSKL